MERMAKEGGSSSARPWPCLHLPDGQCVSKTSERAGPSRGSEHSTWLPSARSRLCVGQR